MKVNVSKSGFTLIEILAVLALIAILTTIVISAVSDNLNTSTIGRMKLQENDLKNAAKIYISDYCEYPINSTYICPLTKSSNGYSGEISLNTLVTAKYIDPIKLKGVTCSGKVVVENSEATPYIQCGSLYETEGYAE